MIDLRQLKTLKAIEQFGSVSAAAEQLHLTQSALSHQLRELEEWLEAPVFVRKSKPPQFSLMGARLLALADEVLPLMQAAERDIRKLQRGQSGRLNMAMECHSCFDWLMPALNAFRRHWPEVELDFQSGFQGDAQADVLDGQLDWVVTSNPSQLSGLVYLPLFHYESVLVLGVDHPLNEKAVIYPDDLVPETLISYPVDDDRLDIVKNFLTPAGVMPSQRRYTELTMMMVQLVASGRGVCALPAWAAAEFVAKQWVKTRALGESGVWCTLYAAVREADAELPYVQELQRIIQEGCLRLPVGVKSIMTAASK
ncbi:MAG: LysR family transcriptional regulator [Moraxellaceae bacterium]|nr:LysR family transcriptional regulator [Moraxellaceae bacterium]